MKRDDKHVERVEKPEKTKPSIVAKSMRRSASTSGLSLVIHPGEIVFFIIADNCFLWFYFFCLMG